MVNRLHTRKSSRTLRNRRGRFLTKPPRNTRGRYTYRSKPRNSKGRFTFKGKRGGAFPCGKCPQCDMEGVVYAEKPMGNGVMCKCDHGHKWEV